MIQIDLSQQHILVTGASDGIGREIALFLMEMGAKVAIHYHKNKASAEEMVGMYPETDSQIFKADFADPSAPVELWNTLIKEFKRIDAIVLNAGVFMKQPADGALQDWFGIWKKTMSINLDAAGMLQNWASIILNQIKAEGSSILRAGLCSEEKRKNTWPMPLPRAGWCLWEEV